MAREREQGDSAHVWASLSMQEIRPHAARHGPIIASSHRTRALTTAANAVVVRAGYSELSVRTDRILANDKHAYLGYTRDNREFR